MTQSGSSQTVQGTEASQGEAPQAENHDKFSSPMDVYRWLEEEGHFPRSVPPRSDATKLKTSNTSGDAVANATVHSSAREDNAQFCAVCGLSTRAHARFHGQQKEKDRDRDKEKDSGDPVNSRVCPMPEWATKAPLLDVNLVRSHIYQRVDQAGVPAKTGDNGTGAPQISMRESLGVDKEILRAEEPSLIYAVQKTAAALRLPAIDSGQTVSFDPDNIREVGDVEKVLAPYAILATATRVLVKKLVHGGLQAMEARSSNASSGSASLMKDAGSATGSAHGSRTGARAAGARGSAGGRRQVLTPTHVVRGIVNGAPLGNPTANATGINNSAGGSPSSSAIAMLIGLTRLGVETPETRVMSSDMSSAATVGQGNVAGDQLANRE